MDTVLSGAPPEQALPTPGSNGVPYYSISEAAALLRVSRVTIWRWIRAGHLPVLRLGHRTARIMRADLERVLAQRESAGSRPGGTAEPGAGPAAEHGHLLDGAPHADWEALGASEHFVQFYEAEGFLLDVVASFIGGALRAGNAGIVVVTEAHREGIEDRLRADGLDIVAARAAGRYVSLNAAETLLRIMVDGQPDPARFAEVVGVHLRRVAEGGRCVRVFGEMVALLVEAGNAAAAVRLEALWNELRQAHPFSLMCGYPLDGFGDEAPTELLGEVCAEHSLVIPAEGYSALENADDRLRAIVELQRKARALEAQIAQRQQAEERLRAALAAEQRQELELRDFVETAPLGMHWVGPDGTLQWANRAELELLGYRPEEVIGHHIAEFHADRDVIDDILARLSRGETLREYPARLRCKDGSIKHVLIDSSVLWEDGRFVHSRCFTRDVTALRRIEEERAHLLELERAAWRAAQHAAARTRRLQEITGQLSQSLEAEQVLATIAHAAADLLQVPVGAVFLLEPGEPDGDFTLAAAHGIDEARVPDLCLPRRASLAGRAVDEGRTLVVGDVRETPGTALPALLTGETAGSEIAAPIIAGAERLGVVKAFSATVRRFSPEDAALLTTLAAAAAVAITNARLYREAQDAIAARDAFLAAAAHDLKTPLTAIKGTAQLLHRKVARIALPGAERLVAGLVSIDAAATRMGHQVDELLDLTRLQMGQRLELRPCAVDAVELVRRVVAEQQQGSERHTIRVETALPELIGTWDALRLERVLDNLLSNAIKYSPAGGDVVVSVAREDEDGEGWAVLAVRDQGLGIPAVDLPRIFERFRRATNVAGQIGGTGIGLASARQIVEQHGGRIGVASLEGAGSTFTVRLPLAVPGAGASPETARDRSAHAPEKAHGSGAMMPGDLSQR